jgi:hypothetical protein
MESITFPQISYYQQAQSPKIDDAKYRIYYGQEGDVVTVVLSCNAPMILRPVREGIWNMLRVCCLFHSMDSRAVNKWHAMGKSLNKALLFERVEG